MPNVSIAGAKLGSSIQSSEIDALAVTEAKLSSAAQTKLNDKATGHINLNLQKPESVGAGTWVFSVDASSPFNTFLRNSSTADGDNCTYKAYLGAGTYTIQVNYRQKNVNGKMDLFIDADKVISAQDHYAGAESYNNIYEETGVVVATAGLKDIKIALNGKNASSSDYVVYISAIVFIRTA
jgi:hypothetical protein